MYLPYLSNIVYRSPLRTNIASIFIKLALKSKFGSKFSSPLQFPLIPPHTGTVKWLVFKYITYINKYM